jgi:lipopolysaccharide/colanic/teichoic acid biosynthesis glycosyltransferase
MKKWETLPAEFQNPEVKPYYDRIKKKWLSRFFKRFFDFLISFLFLIFISPLLLVLALLVKCTSKGPVFFKQERISRYGKPFFILKFRTMVVNADKLGPEITVEEDPRITKFGRFLRRFRLDELPQFFNVLFGQMSLVGPRPEVRRYVQRYLPEYYATLLLPAGITCTSSIHLLNEANLLEGSSDVDRDYVEKVLPIKMPFNLEYIKRFNLFRDFAILWETFFAVLHHPRNKIQEEKKDK